MLFLLFVLLAARLAAAIYFQANQTFIILKQQIPGLAPYPWLVGVVMAFMVGIVIIGGIKRIGSVTSKMVPFMCVFLLPGLPGHYSW